MKTIRFKVDNFPRIGARVTIRGREWLVVRWNLRANEIICKSVKG